MNRIAATRAGIGLCIGIAFGGALAAQASGALRLAERRALPDGAQDPSAEGLRPLSVAAADFDRDGFADIVVAADSGGGSRVRVFSGKDGSVLADLLGIDDTTSRGGREWRPAT